MNKSPFTANKKGLPRRIWQKPWALPTRQYPNGSRLSAARISSSCHHWPPYWIFPWTSCWETHLYRHRKASSRRSAGRLKRFPRARILILPSAQQRCCTLSFYRKAWPRRTPDGIRTAPSNMPAGPNGAIPAVISRRSPPPCGMGRYSTCIWPITRFGGLYRSSSRSLMPKA